MTDIRTLWRHHELSFQGNPQHRSAQQRPPRLSEPDRREPDPDHIARPDGKWTKAAIAEWLEQHNVPRDSYDSHATKEQMLALVSLAEAAS